MPDHATLTRSPRTALVLVRQRRSSYNEVHDLREDFLMVQVTVATFENGVLVPDQPLNLSPNARVRLMVNLLDGDDDALCQKAWQDLQRLWQASTFDSKGDRLTREQLHERR